MLQVMLVDDKKSIVDGLEVLIDWKSLGYEITAKTVSAKEAVEIARTRDFDLIITDIRMPEMFGMELITEISSFSPGTKFIIVSAYSEFEYAKWAIDYQVSGYLIKPIDENELTGLLRRLKVEFEKAEEYSRQNMVTYFANILSGDTVHADKPEALDLKADFRYVEIREVSESVGSGVKSESMEKITDIIKGYNTNKDGCFIIKSGLSEIELIINEETLSLNAETYLDGIKQRILEAGITDFVIFAGEKVEAISDINNSKNTVKILEDALFYEENKVFFYEDYKDAEYTENISDNNIIQKIIDAIKDQDEEGVKASVDTFHDIIVRERVKPEIVSGYINKIIFDMIDCFGESGNDIIPIVYRWSVLRKSHYITHDIVYSFLKEITEEFCNMLTDERNRRRMGVVGEIAEYLKRNYSNPELGLSWIAKKYFITPAYLGKMFKEKTGVSFNSYLMNIRIEKAKELLERTEYKIYEIAQMVGFVDSNYFHAKFQELENISPSNYRKNKQQ